MKKYIRATSWIDKDVFDDDDFDMEEFWFQYLCDPEEEVNQELEIYVEPEVQGGIGNMFLFDESGDDRFESVDVDFDDWNDNEVDMAKNSSSAEDYKNKYRAYIKQLCNI